VKRRNESAGVRFYTENRCDVAVSRDVYEPIDDVDYALDLDP